MSFLLKDLPILQNLHRMPACQPDKKGRRGGLIFTFSPYHSKRLNLCEIRHIFVIFLSVESN